MLASVPGGETVHLIRVPEDREAGCTGVTKHGDHWATPAGLIYQFAVPFL